MDITKDTPVVTNSWVESDVLHLSTTQQLFPQLTYLSFIFILINNLFFLGRIECGGAVYRPVSLRVYPGSRRELSSSSSVWSTHKLDPRLMPRGVESPKNWKRGGGRSKFILSGYSSILPGFWIKTSITFSYTRTYV